MKRNVLLIGIDTLRASSLSAYGYPRRTSPFIDKIAKEGILFENCIAPAIPTHPGWTTILSGTHPLIHGIVSHMGSHTLKPKVKWLPEILQRYNYYTIAVDNLKLWFVNGFTEYLDIGKADKDSLGGLIDEISNITAENVNSVAISRLRDLKNLNKKGKPFFMFLHYWDTHVPYSPPQPFNSLFYNGDEKNPLYRGIEKVKIMSPLWFQFREWLKEIKDDEYVRAMYDSEIAYLDTAIKELLLSFEKEGLLKDTVIVVTSDHGEALGEHDVFFDHHMVYNQDIHVPLIFANISKKYSNIRIKERCEHSDIAPTILDILDIKEQGMTGHSLLPNVTNQKINRNKKGEEKPFLSMINTWNSKIAITVGKYKLITTLKDYDLYGRPPGYKELFDLRLDPGETVNIAEGNKKIVEKLLNLQESYINQMIGDGLNPLDDEPISLRGKIDEVSTFYHSDGLKIKKNTCNWTVPSPSDIKKIRLLLEVDNND
jgi:arylsulfatase A-like enzyme